jgi:2-polyprenyl-3-methyl-5-hydroxy-6-metoxy-1,4-benzoquinol methylase
MTTSVLDPAKTEAFGQTMVEVLNHGAIAMMIAIGHRTGLFDVMDRICAATSAQLAEAAGMSERYVREWLGAMVTGGIVEYNPVGATYRLPPEHAAWLTRAASPNNLAASTQWISVLGHVEDDIVDAFRHGQGVPYSAYHRFHEVMAEESGQSVVAVLTEQILPLVPGSIERLERGIDVLDIGCGAGRAVSTLAATFPHSRFVGYDLSDKGITMARSEAQQQGLENARFEVKDVAKMDEPSAYDLITAFDAIHDQARPAEVLRNIARALKPGGTFLMQDISGSSDVQDDIAHPLGPFLYTVSCMHCMSVSLANGGLGLGAMWGKKKALEMLREAGFRDVKVESLPHDPLNFYYITTRPS